VSVCPDYGTAFQAGSSVRHAIELIGKTEKVFYGGLVDGGFVVSHFRARKRRENGARSICGWEAILFA
jgi:hypothetical protein